MAARQRSIGSVMVIFRKIANMIEPATASNARDHESGSTNSKYFSIAQRQQKEGLDERRQPGDQLGTMRFTYH
jgi:hypothetical protein